MEEQLVIEEFAASPEGEPFLLELGSWEGPLDLLLALARSQKVDLREISILALVEQYLDFIANAKALKLEIAADYLVMAAWLAYLKSCLLLPREPHVDPSPEELALRLQLRVAHRTQRLRHRGAEAGRLHRRWLRGTQRRAVRAQAGLGDHLGKVEGLERDVHGRAARQGRDWACHRPLAAYRMTATVGGPLGSVGAN